MANKLLYKTTPRPYNALMAEPLQPITNSAVMGYPRNMTGVACKGPIRAHLLLCLGVPLTIAQGGAVNGSRLSPGAAKQPHKIKMYKNTDTVRFELTTFWVNAF